jgi:hypothetical protein
MVEKTATQKFFNLSPVEHEDAKKAMMPIYLDCIRMLRDRDDRRPLGLTFKEERNVLVQIYSRKFVEEFGFYGDIKSDLIIQKIANPIKKADPSAPVPMTDTFSFRNIFDGESHVMREAIYNVPYFGYIKQGEASNYRLEKLAKLIRESNEYKEMFEKRQEGKGNPV